MRNFPICLSVSFSPTARGPGRVSHLHNLPCSFFCGGKTTGQINRRKKKIHWRLKHRDLTFGSGSLWAANCRLSIAGKYCYILPLFLCSSLGIGCYCHCQKIGHGVTWIMTELLWLLLCAGLGLCFFKYIRINLQRPRERWAEAFPPLPHFPFCLFSQRLKFCILYCSVFVLY